MAMRESRETKKKLIEIEASHEDWLKQMARELALYEKDVLRQVFEYAIKHNIMDSYKSRVVSSQIQKTIDQLAQGAKDIASLRAKAEELLRAQENTQTQEG
jgi:hypothetical protein